MRRLPARAACFVSLLLFCASAWGALDEPPLDFEGFDETTAYPGVPCEVHMRVWDGKWPYRCELTESTGGVTLDADRRLIAWSPKKEGETATFTVRVTDAAGATVTRKGAVTCTRAGFYFVDGKTGADDNPGAEARPWKTIARASAMLKAGETALVRAGRYNEPVGPLGPNYWSRPTLTPQNSGEPGRPITFRAYPGETVIIENSRIGTSGRKYVTWDGFVLAYGTMVGIFGSDGSVCRGLFIHGHTTDSTDNHDGIRIQNTRRFLVEDCHIRNVKGRSMNSAGIKVYHGCTGVVQNNHLYGSHVNVFDKDSSQGVHYRRNVFENGNFQGNNQKHTKNLRIYENLFLRSGINLHVQTDGVEIHNNTLVGAQIGSGGQIADTHCWNNILWNTDTQFIWDTCDYNIYWTPDAKKLAAGPTWRVFRYADNEKTYRSLAEWQQATGLDAHSRVGDPGFVDAANGDYHLKAGAPALRAGKDGGHIGAFGADGPLIGIRGAWRDRKPVPEEEAKTEADAHLLKN